MDMVLMVVGALIVSVAGMVLIVTTADHRKPMRLTRVSVAGFSVGFALLAGGVWIKYSEVGYVFLGIALSAAWVGVLRRNAENTPFKIAYISPSA